MEKEFVRNFDSLKKIYDFTEDFFNTNEVAESVRYPVHFALEELFTNMVKYNPGNMNTIVVDLDADPDKVRVTITDYDVDKFDVSKKREVDTESPVEDRPVGGLGLHLIRHMVDSLDYHYEDRQSRITFTKGTG
jgi:anti-sigma regulatory factor (Ser/Thr protein kinase)